jgi:hypothetical protein
MVVDEFLTTLSDVASLASKESYAANIRLKLFLTCLGIVRGRPILFEKRRRDDVDLFVSALG